MNQSPKSVIVIGAGLSGLTAADQILKKTPKTNLIVIQANSRVGGRTYSKQMHGAFFDYGGMWVGPHQKHVIHLAKRAKESFIKQECHGAKILQLNGKVQVYKSKIPKNVPLLGLIQMQYYIYKIDKMARTVPLQNPSLCPNSIQWDSITVYTWIQNHIYFQKVKKLIEACVRAVFGVQPSQISMLFFLWYVHQSKSFNNLIQIQDHNQDKKLIYGSQYLSNFLVKEIQKDGGKVILNSPVRQVISKQKIEVICEENSYICDYLIVAMPPVSVQRIQFTPKLSRQRQFICQKNFMGSIIKILILYKTRFWKDKHFSGQTLSDCINSPVFNAYDDSRPTQDGKLQPALVVFSNAAISRYWGSKESIKQRTIQKLAQYFGDQALQPMDIHIQNWDNQPFIRGGPIGNFPTGTLSQIGKLTNPENNIHWAGTQLAYQSQGFMDGAIQSGIRAGEEVIKQICKKVGEQQSDKEVSEKEKRNIEGDRVSGNFVLNVYLRVKQLGNRIFSSRRDRRQEVPYQKYITASKRWFNKFI